MRLRNTNPAAVRSARFTLVELLTVMVIAAVLLALTVPVVVKLTSSSSVGAAARVIGSMLRLARQEAIVRRRYVAVLLPAAQGADRERKFAAARACYVDKMVGATITYAFNSWVPNTKWTLFPAGAVVWEADGQKAVTDTDGSSGDFSALAVMETPTATAYDCRAVIFAPGGRVAGSDKFIHLGEGFYESGNRPLGKNVNSSNQPFNWVEIKVDQYTGRITFYTPESPPP